MNSFFRQRQFIFLATRNVLLNWRHSLATMLAIITGFTAISLFDGFMQDMNNEIIDGYISRGMLGHVVIEKKEARQKQFEDPWNYSLSGEDQKFLAENLSADPRVAGSIRFLRGTGLISNGSVTSVFMGYGYDIAQGAKMRGPRWEWNTIAGTPLHITNGSSVLIGTGLARRLDCKFKNQTVFNPKGGFQENNEPFSCPDLTSQLSVTTEHAQINALDLKTTGIVDVQLREINDHYVAMPLAMAQQLFDTDRITRISLYLKNPRDIEKFILDFSEKADKAGKKIDFVKWIEHPVAQAAKGGLEILNIFRILFMSVVGIIAGMSVANTMMKSINERIREIGTLRSIGFKRKDISFMFSLEGLFIAFFSCLTGIILTTFFALIISRSGLTYRAGILSTPIPLKISFAFSHWMLTILILLSISFFATWFISRKVSRMVIAETLRYVA